MGILKRLNQTVKLPEYILGLKTSAVCETVMIIGLAVLLNITVGDGNRFNDIYPHPFSYLLLLIVVQYGANEGFLCIILMIAAVYAGNMPEQKITQSNYAYWVEIYKQPIGWIAINLFLGGLSRKKNNLIKLMKENVAELTEQSETIAGSYEKLQKRNQNLELKIAGELSSIIKVFDAAKSLATMSRNNYSFSVSKIIEVILEPEKFSFYLLKDNELKLRAYRGWEDETELEKSYSPSSLLYKEVVFSKKKLNCLRQHDKNILPPLCVAAVPLIDYNSGTCVGMLKIDDIEFYKMNLRWMKLLNLVASWIGSSIYAVNEIQHAKENTITRSASQMYTDSFLKRQTQFLTALACRLQFPLTKITITVIHNRTVSDQENHAVAYEVNKAIKETLRAVDQIFETKGDVLSFSILLPGTPEENAHIVISKIRGKMKNRKHDIIKYEFTIESLVTENDYYDFNK